jgi:hypothetical protein
MKGITGRLLIAAGMLAGLLVVFSCRIKPVTELEARKMAEDKFLKVCAEFRLDRNAYSGPVVTKVGGFPYEFEWRNRSSLKRDGVLVMVTERGLTNVSFLDSRADANNAHPAVTK